MVKKFFDFEEGHTEQLKVFCQQVAKTRVTPDLISFVSSETAYIDFCRMITNANEQDRKIFTSFCRKNGLNQEEIRSRVYLAATALGMCKRADYYGILGVSPDADDTAIKQSYRKKAQMLHPDKFRGDQDNSDAFIELHAAYAHLSNPGLRKIYNETRQYTGHWVEGHIVPAPSKRRSGVGHFIGWICLVAGGILMAAYAFDYYQNKSYYLSVQQPFEARLEETAPASVAVLTNKAVTDEISKPMYGQNNISRTEVDNETPYEAAQTFIKHTKSGAFSKRIKKGSVEKTVPADYVGRLRKAASVKAPNRVVIKNTPPLRKVRIVPQLDKTTVPKKVTRPVTCAITHDVGTVFGAHEPDATQTNANAKRIDAEDFYLLQKLRVLSFLYDYTKTYEKKDLEKFRTFFSNNALEQGRPFETLLSKYQKTFDSVEALKFKIELKSVSLERWGNKIYIEGNFTTHYQLPEERGGSCIGLIRMELLDEAVGLLVSRLDYDVDEW